MSETVKDANSSFQGIGPVGKKTPANMQAYRTALNAVESSLAVFSLPDISTIISRWEPFPFEMSKSWVMSFPGESLLKDTADPHKRLHTRVSSAKALFDGIEKAIGDENPLKPLVQSQRKSLVLILENHDEAIGNIDLYDYEAAHEMKLSETQAQLAGLMGISSMRIIGETPSGDRIDTGTTTYIINRHGPEI